MRPQHAGKAGVTYQRSWSLKQDLRSPRWTTRLDEVPTVMAR
ncbi:DUF4113 domain-containing protein [Brevundimonas pishanensis]|nr:DUF4113 domain-containing protein [Brevundimonas pishanensis]